MKSCMDSNVWKRIQHRIEYAVMRGFMILVWLVSLRTALLMADCLGLLAFRCVRVRRKVVLANLRRAFPEKSSKEIFLIARRTYQNFIKLVFEFVRFPLLDGKMVSSLCSAKGLEHLDWALERGKGAILLGGHFGNWELFCAALGQWGYPLSLLVQRQNNAYVDELITAHRRVTGNRIIGRGVAVRGVIKALRNNEFVILLADQDAGRDGIFVDFLGIPTSGHQGPAVLSLKTGAPIIFFTPVRLPRGRHRFAFKRLTFDHLSGATPENIREVTQAHALYLERMIRAYPDHWFWMHRRWKSSPVNDSIVSNS